jgi:non-heme chloroperoxidase
MIGHSMGAAIVERVMATRPLRAAALIAPIPPGGLGPVASRLLAWQPEYLVNMQRFDAPHLAGDMLAALRPMYFSNDVESEVLLEAAMHLTIESARALMDLTLRLHDGRPVAATSVFVLGASEDRISTPRDVHATATMYGVDATIIPGLAHDDDAESVPNGTGGATAPGLAPRS